MNNKYFKDKNLGSVLQSGIKIYTNMDKDVQQTLQDRINNGSFYKNEDQQVGATILDSKTGGLVAISGGRNYKNVVERNQATDPHYRFIIKTFLSLWTCNRKYEMVNKSCGSRRIIILGRWFSIQEL